MILQGTETGGPRHVQRRAAGALFFLQGVCFASGASRIPSIQQRLGLTEAALGLVLLALPAGSMVALPAVSSIGFLGFLVGPPLIGLVAGVATLRGSFTLIAMLGLGVAHVPSGAAPRLLTGGPPRPGSDFVCFGTRVAFHGSVGTVGGTARGEVIMHLALVRRGIVLLAAVVIAGLGCAHTQPPERQVHVISGDAGGVGANAGSGTGGAGIDSYCNELQKQCFDKCWRRKPGISSIKKHSGDHYKHCDGKCLNPTMDAALGWLKEHKTEVVIGTVVIVGGMVAAPYVIAIMGGALVLAPL